MKQAIFVNSEYDYDYEEQDGRHTLYRSNGSHWNSHARGEAVMTIKDDGNGLIFKLNKEGRIDYSQAQELFILLKLVNQPAVYEISSKVPL